MPNSVPYYRRLAEILLWNPTVEPYVEQREKLLKRLLDMLPSGAGIDTGTTLEESSTPEKLIFSFSYHHMTEYGMYDGWTDHTLVVKASLVHGFDFRITGRNRNGVKDYLGDVFHYVLSQEVDF